MRGLLIGLLTLSLVTIAVAQEPPKTACDIRVQILERDRQRLQIELAATYLQVTTLVARVSAMEKSAAPIVTPEKK